MEYIVKHYEDGYQVFECNDQTETLIASFHREPQTSTGKKSRAQIRAEEYCDFLNRNDTGQDFMLDLEDDAGN
jgi:hypothetical protein